MSRRRAAPVTTLPCYAMVLPGLEEVSGEEIQEVLGVEVKRSIRGTVVFRPDEIDPAILTLRTTEDVFLLAWGTDKLTYRAQDLQSIQRWTAKEVKWDQLFKVHHLVRPLKSRPTYRLVVQMHGTHGYRRSDAREALAAGLRGKIPANWRPAEENATVEIWLTIDNNTAVCGVRLSDRTMRHKTYKTEHMPASLRPTVAAAMVRLGEIKPKQVVVDPMCGAGTILAEALLVRNRYREHKPCILGGDLFVSPMVATAGNIRGLGRAGLARWDARQLPLPDESVDRIISNPPFGKQLSRPEEIGQLYQDMLLEYHRVLRPRGKAVLLVSDVPALREAAAAMGWKRNRQVRVRVLGQAAAIVVLQRPVVAERSNS